MSYDIYTGLLKAFPLRNIGNVQIDFTYDTTNSSFETLKNKYSIESIAGIGTDFEKAVNLLMWVSKHIYHKGDFNKKIPYNSLELLEYSFEKDLEHGINCVALATVLSECLLSIGIKSRKVFIMPCSPYDGDNHVVTHAYINELNKWVMLDPTYSAYLLNDKKQPLSLLEIREHLANQNQIFFSDGAKYNDNDWNDESEKSGIEYFAKNLFYMQTSEMSTFEDTNETGITTTNRFITLCPDNYDVKQIRLSNIDYRVKLYENFRQAEERKENVKKENYNYCSVNDFERQAEEWKENVKKENYNYCSVNDFEKQPN